MKQNRQFSLIIGDRRLPLDIHSLAVDEQGTMVGAERRNFTFRFSYRQILLSAQFCDGGDAARIDLSGDVGPMPYSAESALARAELQSVLDAANGDLGDVFRVVNNRILLVGRLHVANPVTAVGLVHGIVTFLLPVKPYLETVDVFLAPAGEGATGTERSLRPAWRRDATVRRR